jgi:hypothetical protein
VRRVAQPTIRATIYIAPDVYQWAKDAAAHEGISLTRYIEDLLRAAMEAERQPAHRTADAPSR